MSSLDLSKLDFDLFDDYTGPGVDVRFCDKGPTYDSDKYFPTAYRQRRVTPIIEIFSVSIHSHQKSKAGEKCEIHGYIIVVDRESGDTLDLFVRSKDDPECIVYDGTLSLSSPTLHSKEGVNIIRPSEHFYVKVLLFDKAHNDVRIAEGEFSLDRTVTDYKGEVKCELVQGIGGFASVNYAMFPYAVVASVEVLFFYKDNDFDLLRKNENVGQSSVFEYADSDSDYDGGFRDETYDEDDDIEYDKRELGSAVIDLFGTVTARNDMVFDVSSDKRDYFNATILFNRSLERSVKVRSGEFIQLSRSIVAVPAFSSLNIEVNFSDRDTRKPFGRNTVEFRPEHDGTYMKDIVGDNGRFRVRVKWSDGYPRLNRTKFKRSSAVDITSKIRNVDEVKRQKLLLEQPSTLCSVGIMPPATPIEYYEPVPLIEVFTVVIYGEGSEPFNFYGSILVSDKNFRIFSRDAKSPQPCPALGSPLEINCHHSFDVLDDFCIWINLKDVNKSSISKGHFYWRTRNIYVDEGKWLNRRLCSIIRGDKGFAAVHYAIFSDALSAKVDVKVFGKTSSCKVYGNLVASSVSHEVKSSYKEQYYQSVIFHKDAKEEHPVQLYGFSIPLQKSVIAFPSSSSLTFQGDLMVSSVNDVADNKLPEEIESLKVDLEFKLRRGDQSSGRIEGKDVNILVTVKCESMFN